MVDVYSPMIESLSNFSVTTVCSSKSPSFVAGGPLSLHMMKMNMKLKRKMKMKSTLICQLMIPKWNLIL
jgi:hypothetical protein